MATKQELVNQAADYIIQAKRTDIVGKLSDGTRVERRAAEAEFLNFIRVGASVDETTARTLYAGVVQALQAN
jgi:hypothetical protein